MKYYLQSKCCGSHDCTVASISNAYQHFGIKPDIKRIAKKVGWVRGVGADHTLGPMYFNNHFKIISGGTVYTKVSPSFGSPVAVSARKRFIYHIGKPMFIYNYGHHYFLDGYTIVNQDRDVILKKKKIKVLEQLFKLGWFNFWVIGSIK